MDPVVVALAADERYFPGLYCTVASALSCLDPKREVDVKVLDSGILQKSKDTLSKLINRIGKRARLDFVKADASIFDTATLGPGQSHMTYCRLLLPQLVNVPRLIYLDCDVLVFRDLSELFDLELLAGKVLAAVPDSETLSLADDSRIIAKAMRRAPEGAYFNCGVMLMNLDELRKQNFTEKSLEFFKSWRGHYRFWDQSAFNFLLHGRIDELPEYWNRASWRFDQQQNNELDCLLHYTTSAPWLGGTPGPAQELFERFAAEVALPVNRESAEFKRSARRNFWRNLLASLRALAFPIASLFYRLIGNKRKSAAYKRVAHYWFEYIRFAGSRRQIHQRRIQEINAMKFDLRTSALSS